MISIGGYLYYEKNTGYMYIKKEKYYIPLNYKYKKMTFRT